MKLRITQPGYESFTGIFGMTQFVNGLSVGEVSVETAAGLAVIVRCERYEGATDMGRLDVTDMTASVSSTTGDFNADTAPAPAPAT